MLNSKLFEYKTIKVNGVRFLIRKLSPSLFLDKDYLFPMTSVAEKAKKNNRKISEKELLKCTEEFKDQMRDTILKSVVSLKKSIFSRKQSINTYIDKIMENPEIYSYLFALIVNHSLGLKKKKSPQLTELLQKLSI